MMEVPFSPSRSDTFHLSPTHLRHVDPMQELRNLRRSMSRSPSKLKGHARSPLSLSPAQTPRSPLVLAYNAPSDSTTASRPRAHEIEGAPSTVKNKPALPRSTPIRGLFKMPRSERQPSPAALSESTDFGNSSSSSQEASDGQENRIYTPSHSPPDKPASDSSRPKEQVVPFRTPATRTRPVVTYDLQVGAGSPAKSSPLKRNDGAMKLNSSSLGSPSAKRRSLHGVPYEIAHDLANVSTPGEIGKDSDREPSPDELSIRNTPNRGHLSSRRPYLQQRHPQKPGANRNRRSLEISFATPPPARRSSNRNKPRSSLDSASPTSLQNEADGERQFLSGAVPSEFASIQHARPMRPQPHPLSKAVSPTSPTLDTLTSRSHAANESNVFVPPSAKPSAFSKSLPIGALRPEAQVHNSGERRETAREENSFATPRFFNIAKPDPAAFRSTGLISKRHRNADDMPPPPANHADVPDTPCKRPNMAFYASPTPNPATHSKNAPFGQPAFGTPSRPFDLHSSQAAPSSFSKSIALFGDNVSERRISFTSNDGEDAHSPSQVRESQGDSQSSADELPPTPTKHTSSFLGIKPSSLRSSLFGRRTSVGPSSFVSPPVQDNQPEFPQQSGKLSSSEPLSDPGGKQLDPTVKSGPSTASPSLDWFRAPPSSFARSRLQRRITGKAPSPLLYKASQNVAIHAPSSLIVTKHHVRSPVSRFNARSTMQSIPHTPADNAFPDPSVLSISPNNKLPVSPGCRHNLGSIPSRPPETPTAHRDSGHMFFNPSIMTPHHNIAPHQDIDQVLKSKFKRVEWYAKGEFSEVYKVYQSTERSSTPFSSAVNSFRSVQSQLPDRVFVVKKSKAPNMSHKLRDRKLREASIMRSLGRSDHTVLLIDSWEANYHFYLQMEYCEEGSLDGFLARQGRDGRLDDFRIWKIMVELALGVKHIHDSGFIHLDLKPENIFIDFEGSLKIGDFGLASSWPAPANVEGEGDRRYIGPDLLLGAFDKPADIFAMGMIMYEIAANAIPPDNGNWWQKLRSGDFSGLPSLTSGSSNSLSKDISNGHLRQSLDRFSSAGAGLEPLFSPSLESHTPVDTRMTSWTGSFATDPDPTQVNAIPGVELLQPPSFMLDPNDAQSLDNVVQWMMSPEPRDRPVVDSILQLGGCEWVSGRRRAGAVIYEGRWGPADHVLMAAKGGDTVMVDA